MVLYIVKMVLYIDKNGFNREIIMILQYNDLIIKGLKKYSHTNNTANQLQTSDWQTYEGFFRRRK